MSNAVLLGDADPDLLDALPADVREAAARHLRVPVADVERGEWRDVPDVRLGYGLLVLEGYLTCRIALGTREHLEVLGPGDVLQPWARVDNESVIEATCQWSALSRARLATLEFEVVDRGRPWLAAEVMHRLAVRSRRLSVQMAILSVPSVAARLELLLWHLASRWGRVTANGVLFDVPLKHHELAAMISARRPSVTSALSGLRENGRIRREPRGWLLTGGSPEAIDGLRRQAGIGPTSVV